MSNEQAHLIYSMFKVCFYPWLLEIPSLSLSAALHVSSTNNSDGVVIKEGRAPLGLLLRLSCKM